MTIRLDKAIADLLKKQEPAIARAFASAVADIKNKADIRRLRAALRRGGIEDAIQALDIEPQVFDAVRAEILRTYGNSGVLNINETPWLYPDGTKAVVRFNTLSPQAEAYARRVGSDLIAGITEDTMNAARDVIADGYAFNRKFDRIATDLIGRLDANGKRTGGIIGLGRHQAQWVINMRRYLETDPARALSMTRRDKRFDKTIRKAAETGKPLTQGQIDRMLSRYEDRLVQSRGLVIARTETITAIEQGKAEAWRQGLEKTGLPEEVVLRTWVHTGRALKDRPSHQIMNGMTVRGLSDPFIFADGGVMRYPHDNALGAGPEHIVNCMCRADYRVDRERLKAWRASQAR